MAKRERKGRTEELWMAKSPAHGFLPFAWGLTRRTCVGRILRGGWRGRSTPVRIRITEIRPKSKKAAKRKGTKCRSK